MTDPGPSRGRRRALPFLAAIALSVAVHLSVLGVVHDPIRIQSTPSQPLVAKLVVRTPEQIRTPESPRAQIAPKASKAQRDRSIPAPDRHLPRQSRPELPREKKPAEVAPPILEQPSLAPEPEEVIAAAPPSNPSPAPSTEAEPAPSSSEHVADANEPEVDAASKPPKTIKPMPRHAVAHYALIRGENGLVVGQVIHRWHYENGRYDLASVTEATGIFSLIKPGKLVQTSEGNVTPDGLAPKSFWIQRGQSADKTQASQFDRNAGTLTLGNVTNSRTVPLTPGTQDLLSFLYHLAYLAPTTGDVPMQVTDGRRLKDYVYRVEGTELLETEAGTFQTVHLKRVHRNGSDSVEIWLAVEQDFWPVRIRLRDNDGDVADQIITSLSFDDEN